MINESASFCNMIKTCAHSKRGVVVGKKGHAMLLFNKWYKYKNKSKYPKSSSFFIY